MEEKFNKKIFIGDTIIFMLVAVYGFLQHYGTAIDFNRFLASFFPWWGVWSIIAYRFKIFSEKESIKKNIFWKVILIIIITAPIASIIREFWLNGNLSSISLLFMAIFGGISSIFLIVWRYIYRKKRIG